MRLCISLRSNEGQRLPLSHLDLLRQTLRAYADVDVSQVSFSDLRVPSQIRTIDGENEELRIGVGTLQWWLSSPRRRTLSDLVATFQEGSKVMIGNAKFFVRYAALVPVPEPLATSNAETTARFSCWTPIVARVYSPRTHRKPYFASPLPDDSLFAERIRLSLIEKYAAIHGEYPENTDLQIGFDRDYLERHPRRGTKRIVSDGRPITGVLAPFTLCGSSELLRTAWECGIGDLTNQGFGFVEVLR